MKGQTDLQLSFLNGSFAALAVFGSFLLFVGDLVNGPLMLFTGIFTLVSINKQRRLLTSGLLYFVTVLVFLITQFITYAEFHAMIDTQIAEQEVLDANHSLLTIYAIIVVLSTSVGASLTIIQLRRFYIRMGHTIKEMPEKAMNIV